MKSLGRAVALVGLVLLAAMSARAADDTRLGPVEAMKIATEAYIYGYPLVTMEYTRRVMTNVDEPEGSRAPMGQFVRLREYPNAQYRDVTAPSLYGCR